MDASHRGLLLNRLADAIERDSAYLAVSLCIYFVHLQKCLLQDRVVIQVSLTSLLRAKYKCLLFNFLSSYNTGIIDNEPYNATLTLNPLQDAVKVLKHLDSLCWLLWRLTRSIELRFNVWKCWHFVFTTRNWKPLTMESHTLSPTWWICPMLSNVSGSTASSHTRLCTKQLRQLRGFLSSNWLLGIFWCLYSIPETRVVVQRQIMWPHPIPKDVSLPLFVVLRSETFIHLFDIQRGLEILATWNSNFPSSKSKHTVDTVSLTVPHLVIYPLLYFSLSFFSYF